MKELKKYIGPLLKGDFPRFAELARREIRLHICPYPETKRYDTLEQVPTLYTRASQVTTAPEPKQVVLHPHENTVFVSCMRGMILQTFDYSGNGLALKRGVKFNDQCVEVAVSDKYCFVTTTNFEIEGQKRNKLWILDIDSLETISVVDTHGSWSKVIAVHPSGDQLLISNWESSSVSIVDIRNIHKPRIQQVIDRAEGQWKCPRGIAITRNGNVALVAGFYSGNVTELIRGKGGMWSVSYASPRFDAPRYSGNMRHVLITPDDQLAIISNKGRNMLHFWSIEDRAFVDSVLVGKRPNTIVFSPDKKTVIVSCSGSNRICVVDLVTRKVVGKSTPTASTPTGLCVHKNGFFVAGQTADKLEAFRSANIDTSNL